MVLVRVRSQGDRLLKRAVVTWIIDEDAIVLQSIETLLAELTHPMALMDFVREYELWANGHEIDLHARPAASRIAPGGEVFIKAQAAGGASS